MDKIHIPDLLKCLDYTQVTDVAEFLPGLETLMPVKGWVKVIHRGNYLEVCGEADAIVTLCCHRCLQTYNHRLRVSPHELIWLEAELAEAENAGLEREVPLEDLFETLSPEGDFYPKSWLYEQLCLALPQQQLCDLSCPGIPLDTAALQKETSGPIDRRWAALTQLKQQLPETGES